MPWSDSAVVAIDYPNASPSVASSGAGIATAWSGARGKARGREAAGPADAQADALLTRAAIATPRSRTLAFVITVAIGIGWESLYPSSIGQAA